ncbi:MAG: hypothetical protein EBS05_21595 [Proteobacteria bacterium]|nr:hypothetical protein [Pseudomonadota bacterium]
MGALFQEAMDWAVPESLFEAWRNFCRRGISNSVHWQNMRDFRRDDLESGRDLLILVTKLMAWRQPDHFVRAVSCQLCADSKRLLGQRGLLERLLSEATNGRVKNFGDLGILDMPTHVLVAGPLRLRFPERVLDLGSLREGSSFSEADIARAVIECPATRCVTVENKTSFHQRAVLHPEDLHIHTSYPGSAVLVLLGKLPRTMDFFHAGDTDPAGFDILRDLRHSARLPIRSLGMEVASCVDGPLLSPGELRLLETLVQNPDLVEERPALEMMLVSKRKQRAFEQEHRSPQ